MRRLLLVIAAAGLMLAVLAPVVAGDGGNKFQASLNGYLETPSVSTAGDRFVPRSGSTAPGSSTA